MAYALQNPFTEELEWLQQWYLFTPLDMDETVESCTFATLKWKGQTMLNLAELSETLIQLVYG